MLQGVPDYRGPTLAERIAANMRAWYEAHAGHDDSRRAAREFAQQLAEVKGIAAGAMATGRMSDAELRALAERRAELLGQRLDGITEAMSAPQLLAWVNAQVQPLQGRPFVFEGERPEADQLRGIMARARCPLWWRRQLRRAAVQDREREGRAAGEVSARRRQPYVTHDTLQRHEARKAASAAMMEATELESDTGQVCTIADLAAASVSNKAIRRGELMTRISGCERWAEAHGMRGVFLTLTAPSRFHRVHRHGGINERSDGSTPRDAQAWLCTMWARARAKLQRLGLQVFGFRVAEPHHDGTPHWHLLLWAGTGAAVLAAFHAVRGVWLSEDGDEPGAAQHRCKGVPMERGGAAGYIAKYIAKNIDDAGAVGVEGHTDQGLQGGASGRHEDGGNRNPPELQPDLFGGTARRVEAWASAWGIRQFQAIGQPPVTVWRELRRVDPQAKAGGRLGRALDAVNREGQRRADWAGYVLAQGGMNTGRNYLLRVAMLEREKVGRYESGPAQLPHGVYCAEEPDYIVSSKRSEWRPRGEWKSGYWRPATDKRGAPAFLITAQGIKPNTEAARPVRMVYVPGERERRGPEALRALPWTRVNNCTQRGARDLLAAIKAREVFEPGEGRNHESTTLCATPPPSPANSRPSVSARLWHLSPSMRSRPST